MGREVVELADERSDVEVVAAVNRDPDVNAIRETPVQSADRFESLLETEEPHVVVDFTGPESTTEHARAAARQGVAFVSGTTGLEPAHEAALEATSDSVPVLHAANFSRGIAALREAVESVVADLPAYDVELIETHHDGKRDAPSGTAGDLLAAADRARGGADGSDDTGDSSGIDGEDSSRGRRVHGREGVAPRRDGEVGVHAVRAGDVTGEHVVVVAGNDEQVRLEHRAGDRRAFAAGAIDAADWVADRDPGRYELREVGR
jgi:4-hydroxy-tetrahydrodipicolinate reductase